jgi:hypothetical protein
MPLAEAPALDPQFRLVDRFYACLYVYGYNLSP